MTRWRSRGVLAPMSSSWIWISHDFECSNHIWVLRPVFVSVGCTVAPLVALASAMVESSSYWVASSSRWNRVAQKDLVQPTLTKAWRKTCMSWELKIMCHPYSKALHLFKHWKWSIMYRLLPLFLLCKHHLTVYDVFWYFSKLNTMICRNY